MAKTETRPKNVPAEKAGRIDSVKPPSDLPDGSALDRMTELTRRVLRVPKDEAVAPRPGRHAH